jgi:hypothetical protein
MSVPQPTSTGAAAQPGGAHVPTSVAPHLIGLGVGAPAAASRRSRDRRRSIMSGIVVSMVFVATSGVLGGGARFAWDRLDTGDDATGVLPDLGEPLDSVGIVDPPEMRYVNASVTVQEALEGRVTITQEVDIVNEDYYARVAYEDGTTVEIAKRGSVVAVRRLADGAWISAPPESIESFSSLADLNGGNATWTVATISDLVPPGATPFTTVHEEEEVVDAAIDPLATASNPLRRYKVTIDLERFRKADQVAHGAWMYDFAFEGGMFEMWVDTDGVVRRVTGTSGGIVTDIGVQSWSTTSDRFTEPLVLTAETVTTLELTPVGD